MLSKILAQASMLAVVGVIAYLIGSAFSPTITGSVAVINLPAVQDVQVVGSTIGAGDIVNLSARFFGCSSDLCEDTNGDGIGDTPKACSAQEGFSYVVPNGKVYQITDIHIGNGVNAGVWTSQHGIILWNDGPTPIGATYRSPIELDAGEKICPIGRIITREMIVSGRLIDVVLPAEEL